MTRRPGGRMAWSWGVGGGRWRGVSQMARARALTSRAMAIERARAVDRDGAVGAGGVAAGARAWGVVGQVGAAAGRALVCVLVVWLCPAVAAVRCGGGVRWRARRVRGPTMASVVRWWWAWRRRTAAAVAGPKRPSMPAGP